MNANYPKDESTRVPLTEQLKGFIDAHPDIFSDDLRSKIKSLLDTERGIREQVGEIYQLAQNDAAGESVKTLLEVFREEVIKALV